MYVGVNRDSGVSITSILLHFIDIEEVMNSANMVASYLSLF